LTLNIALLLGGQFCFQLLHQLVPIVPPLVVLAVAYCLCTFIYLDANLRESNRELARARKSMQLRSEQERQRIAEDLHDETLPALSQVARLADKLNIELVDNPIPKEMRQSLDFSVAEMRRVINDLHPSVLETMGFKPALENLLAMLGQESKIQTHFSEEGDFTERELDKFQRLQLYRIVQEALNNVRKHSEATKAQVSIVKRSDKLILAIIDNGKGMQISKTSGQSHGILNIKQRAQLIGAKVAWLEARGYNSGTEVRIELILGSKDNIG
jgi:signal transduction histidine kinase